MNISRPSREWKPKYEECVSSYTLRTQLLYNTLVDISCFIRICACGLGIEHIFPISWNFDLGKTCLY
jgi:hypothetical protein